MYRPNHIGEGPKLWRDGAIDAAAVKATVRERNAFLSAHPKPRAERTEFRDSTYNNSADDDPIPVAALFDRNDDALEESSDGEGVNAGYSVQYADPTPRRSPRNADLEKRGRAGLRERTRFDPAAFRRAIPADILDRLLLPDGGDVPTEADPELRHLDDEARRLFGEPRDEWSRDALLQLRHPYAQPSWEAEFGDGKFCKAPRLKINQSPGLAVGAHEVEASDCLAVVNLHGILVGLRRADKPPPRRYTTEAPFPKPRHGPCRSLGALELMAACAARGLTPSFMAGISLRTPWPASSLSSTSHN